MRRPEVLAPAGDRERLDAALLFGADAVYLAGQQYGMRSACRNFDEAGLRDAVRAAHARGVAVYVTCTVLPRNHELDALPEYLSMLQDAGVDAVIVADLGVMELAARYAPRCALHVSTQFGVVNWATANRLHDMGASRVVLAREMSLEDIATLRAKTAPTLELEAFVHGAMCMSVSGRCVISNYLTGRDANHGECAQPCRWKYHLVEEKRPGEYFSVEEDGDGSYLFNAQDMNMLPHVAALAEAGIDSFKLEGRAKAAYYTAAVTAAYRAAVDGYIASGRDAAYVPPAWMQEEVLKVSHRPYGTGFYFGQPSQHPAGNSYERVWEVSAIVTASESGVLHLEQRNRFFAGDTFDVLVPGAPPVTLTLPQLFDEEGNAIAVAPHPEQKVTAPCDVVLPVGSMLRKQKE